MQYVEYLNHPLHTVSAKEQIRSMISSMMPRLSWSAAELKSTPRPQRKHPESRTGYGGDNNPGLLRMDKLLAIVPAEEVARIARVSARELASWRTRVPLGYSEYLRDLMQHYPSMLKAREMIQGGKKLTAAARELRYESADLRELMQYFSMLPDDL